MVVDTKVTQKDGGLWRTACCHFINLSSLVGGEQMLTLWPGIYWNMTEKQKVRSLKTSSYFSMPGKQPLLLKGAVHPKKTILLHKSIIFEESGVSNDRIFGEMPLIKNMNNVQQSVVTTASQDCFPSAGIEERKQDGWLKFLMKCSLTQEVESRWIVRLSTWQHPITRRQMTVEGLNDKTGNVKKCNEKNSGLSAFRNLWHVCSQLGVNMHFQLQI